MQNVVKFYLKKEKICGIIASVNKEITMDLAHLVSATNRKAPCNSGASHYWATVGEPEASAGNNITVQLECKNCNKRVYEFLTREQYFLCENQIKRSQNESSPGN